MPEFAAHVVTDATPTDDQLDDLVDALQHYAGAVGMTDDQFTVQLTVEADTLAAAAEVALAAVLAAAHVVIGADVEAVAVQVMTDPAFALWLADGLVPTVEAAKILGVTRQRVLALERTDPNLPAPVQRGRAKLWPAAALRRYARRVRTPGRPAASA